MKNPIRHLFFLASILTLFGATPAQAESLQGVVRNINYEGSRSFGLDIPPLTRVYINSKTQFDTPEGGKNLQALKEGDQVEVEGRSSGPGTFTATQVKVTGRNVSAVENLSTDEIQISRDQRFLMGVSQTATLKENGKATLKLRSTEFINTLCKDGYSCEGEGEIGMRFKVSVKGGGEEEIILTSKNHRKPTSPVLVDLSGYTIQLVEVGEDVVLIVVR